MPLSGGAGGTLTLRPQMGSHSQLELVSSPVRAAESEKRGGWHLVLP
jgi:hypothetical protein